MPLDAQAPFAVRRRCSIDREEVALRVADVLAPFALLQLMQQTFQFHDLRGLAIAGFAKCGLKQRMRRLSLLAIHVADLDALAEAGPRRIGLGNKMPFDT